MDRPARPPSHRPLIGISTYPPSGRGNLTLPVEYVDAVRRGGGEPVLVPPGVGDVPALLDRLDGLVLAGGGDVDPAHNEDRRHETVYATHPERDETELAMVEALLARGLPTLAICRGSQMVNVALGGTLVTHLPDVLPDDAPLHRIEPPEPQAIASPVPHEVTVDADSLVAGVMGETTVTPMSWHHQAVDRLGDGLRVVGRAPDGTVEATEHVSHPWLACVQWHPELTAAEDPTQQRLFDELVRASARGGTR